MGAISLDLCGSQSLTSTASEFSGTGLLSLGIHREHNYRDQPEA